MVNISSGMNRGRLHPTTTTSRNTAAILRVILGHAVLVYSVYLWYWTSILWSMDTSQDKTFADQCHYIAGSGLELRFKAQCIFKVDQELVLDWIARSCQLIYCNRGQIFRKPVNANPGLKVNGRIIFSSMQLFFKSNRRQNNIYREPHRKVTKLKPKFSLILCWLNRLWKTRYGSSALRLG